MSRHQLLDADLAHACPASRQCLTTRAHLQDAGVTKALLERALAEGLLIRVRRGVYAPRPLPPRGRHLLRDGQPSPAYVAHVRAALLAAGPRAVADRRSAAVLWAMDLLVEPSAVECRVPRSRTRVRLAGVSVRCSTQSTSDEISVAGLEPVPVTPPLDTVISCCLSRPMLEAVVVADSALRRGLLTVDELAEGLSRRQDSRGRGRLTRLLLVIDPASGSVLESMLRYLLHRAGLFPTSQYVVVGSDGRPVGRVDFCFVEHGLVVECDGRRWHDPKDNRTKDRHRDNALQRLGWRVVRFSWSDVRDSKGYVLAVIRDCLALARAA